MENLNAEKVKSELEGLAKFCTCPEYIKDALALINSQEQRIKELTEKIGDLECKVEEHRADAISWQVTVEEIAKGDKTMFDVIYAHQRKSRQYDELNLKAFNLERKIKELTAENERLRGVGLPDDETYIKLSDAKHAIMDYIGELTVSKYASSVECKSARSGAEGAMNELDYITPAQVAPKSDIARKMQERLKEHLEKPEFPWDSFTVAEEVIDQIAKEMLEDEK